MAFEQSHLILENNAKSISPSQKKALCGIMAGLVEATLCLTPMQNLSLKMTHEAAQQRKQQRYSHFFRGAWLISKESGVRGMLRGLGPLCIKNSMNQAIRFPMFYWLSSKLKSEGKDLNLFHMMLCGGAAGMFSCFFSHPIDVIKTNMMGLENKKYRNSFDCAKTIYQRHSFGGFYAGILPRICRVTLEVGLHFGLFETINKLIVNSAARVS